MSLSDYDYWKLSNGERAERNPPAPLVPKDLYRERSVILFVYGTLKGGFPLNWRLREPFDQNGANAKYIGPATTAPLYTLSCRDHRAFPFLRDGGASVVHGELWDVPEQGMEVLDYVEGVHQGAYRRGTVELADGQLVTGYLFCWPRTADEIDCGPTWLGSNQRGNFYR